MHAKQTDRSPRTALSGITEGGPVQRGLQCSPPRTALVAMYCGDADRRCVRFSCSQRWPPCQPHRHQELPAAVLAGLLGSRGGALQVNHIAMRTTASGPYWHGPASAPAWILCPCSWRRWAAPATSCLFMCMMGQATAHSQEAHNM